MRPTGMRSALVTRLWLLAALGSTLVSSCATRHVSSDSNLDEGRGGAAGVAGTAGTGGQFIAGSGGGGGTGGTADGDISGGGIGGSGSGGDQGSGGNLGSGGAAGSPSGTGGDAGPAGVAGGPSEAGAAGVAGGPGEAGAAGDGSDAGAAGAVGAAGAGGEGGTGIPTCGWARMAEAVGDAPTLVSDLLVLPTGDVYVVGKNCGGLGISFLRPGDTPVELPPPIGSCGDFLAHYSPTGELLWVKRLCNRCGADEPAIDFLPGGDLLVLGRALGPDVGFVPDDPEAETLTLSGGGDGFLMRLDAGGTKKWVQLLKGTGEGILNDVATLPDGAFAIGGTFWNTLDLNVFSSPAASLTAQEQGDSFVAFYESTNALRWVSHGRGRDDNVTRTVDANADYTCAVGYTGENTTFNYGQSDAVTLSTNDHPGSDAWAAVHDSRNGNLIWASVFSAPGYPDAASAARVFDDGSCIVSGYFTEAIVFRPGEADQVTLSASSTADGDLFVVRFDPTGTVAWAKQLGSPTDSWADSQSLSASDDEVFVGASYLEGAAMDSLAVPGGTTTETEGAVLVLDAQTGSPLDAIVMDPTDATGDVVLAAQPGPDHTLYIGGFFLGTDAFPTSADTTSTLTSASDGHIYSSAFVLRYCR